VRDAGAASYDFHPMSAGDLPLMLRWLEMPHIREWWGDPETELGYVRDMIEGRDTTRPFIFSVDGEPMGYIQYWFIGDHQNATWIADHPWIGDPGKLAKGIGSGALRAFAERLAGQGYRTIVIDPDPENRRAVRAYEKAGFRAIPRLLDRTGDTLIMQYDLKENVPDQ
jgi:RimJ/RimL family protein N-acetyltransferase